ncbi:MAG TPA: hypothetical protein VEZ11_06100 [Thermoanaerobaculia bacterium]|nr:hypothetical protein [Thermoanaerobaculia bacterium]
MRRLVTGLVVFLLAFTLLGAPGRSAFSGTYTVNGTSAAGAAYQGVLTIAPRGEIYDVHWAIGNVQYVGVGVVINETLAVTYSGATDRSWSGVIAYRQRGDGSLEGRTAILGGAATAGRETAVRK